MVAGMVLVAACSGSTTSAVPSATLASLASSATATTPPPTGISARPVLPSAILAPTSGPTSTPTAASIVPPGRAGAAPCQAHDKFALWSSGKATLRGANVFMGADPANPAGGPGVFGDGRFTQTDLDDLARAGANYVQISHAGLWRQTPPYDLDAAAQANLDSVIQMAAKAGLYAVIAFRTGPGRNENAIIGRDRTVLESIWTSELEQAMWAAMLRYTAERYRDDPTVVGYDPMVEPNDSARRGFPDPQTFYAQYGGTLEDFNGLAQRITKAVREVDPTTPILLEPDGFGNVPWLAYLKVTGDPRTVYTVHDYMPFDYTHELRPLATYPGPYDVYGDGQLTLVDKTYLDGYLRPVRTYAQGNGVPVAVTEFGVHWTAPNAAGYLRDRIDLQDRIGNWAVWTWQAASLSEPFNMHDPSPSNAVLRAAWASNCLRPSD